MIGDNTGPIGRKLQLQLESICSQSSPHSVLEFTTFFILNAIASEIDYTPRAQWRCTGGKVSWFLPTSSAYGKSG
ncbi:hypothetical protein RJT34_19908 [Clitoria ternatea]|uniref:Uncharacterized protein n=1 Tax=Clitoria ternatea TaxID=43366 RepID=A0AAN9ISC2_CLITE